MAAAMIIMAVAAFLIPHASLLSVLVLIIFILGAAAGLMTVGANTLIVWIHQGDVGPWLNGLHFFGGVGAVLSPLIITLMIAATGSAAGAFWILALIILVPAGWLLLVSSPTIRGETAEINGGKINFKLVIPIAMIFILYVGAEVRFSGWLFTVTVAEHPGSETSAGYLTAAFWAAISAGRLVAIPLSRRITSRKILITDFLGSLIGLGIIITLSSSFRYIWIGTIVLGLSMASVFPTLLTYAENRMQLTGRVSGWFFGAAAFGGMTIPFLVGQLINTTGPKSTMVFLFFVLLAALMIFAGIEFARQVRSSEVII